MKNNIIKNNNFKKILAGVPVAVMLSVTGCGHDNHDMTRNSITNDVSKITRNAIENGKVSNNDIDKFDRSTNWSYNQQRPLNMKDFSGRNYDSNSDFDERGSLGQGNSFGGNDEEVLNRNVDGFGGDMYGLAGDLGQVDNFGMGINSGALTNNLSGLNYSDYAVNTNDNKMSDNALLYKNSIENKNGFNDTIGDINEKTGLHQKAEKVVKDTKNQEKVTVGDVINSAKISENSIDEDNLYINNMRQNNKRKNKSYTNNRVYKYA